MDYAVISIKDQQYKVSEGEEILVDKLTDEKVDIKTLLLVDGEKVMLGKPVLEKAKVKFELLGDEQGKKLHVRKYKSKSRYRKKIGFRPKYTRIKINSITV